MALSFPNFLPQFMQMMVFARPLFFLPLPLFLLFFGILLNDRITLISHVFCVYTTA